MKDCAFGNPTRVTIAQFSHEEATKRQAGREALARARETTGQGKRVKEGAATATAPVDLTDVASLPLSTAAGTTSSMQQGCNACVHGDWLRIESGFVKVKKARAR